MFAPTAGRRWTEVTSDERYDEMQGCVAAVAPTASRGGAGMSISMPWWALVAVLAIASSIGCIIGMTGGRPKI